MGGYGSGQRVGGTRPLVEACRSLDVNMLNRAGCFGGLWRGGWEWKRDGERVAWIDMTADREGMTLTYRCRQGEAEWQDVSYRIPVVWASCRFGGERPYFKCPGVVDGILCGRRVLKIYAAGRYFLCRNCYGLAYASQNEGEIDRAHRRLGRMRAKLQSDQTGLMASLPERPKVMHQRTYERLTADLINAEIEAEEMFEQMAAHFIARIAKKSGRGGIWS